MPLEIINALLIYPGRPPELVLLENTRSCIEGVIGSKTTFLSPWGDNIAAIFAPEGERLGFEANRILVQSRGKNSFPVRPVFGPMLICSLCSFEHWGAQFRSLNVNQCIEYMTRFAIPDEIFTDPKTGKRIWKYQQVTPFQDNESEE